MVSWHPCAFINWEKPCELPHFIFLLSLRLHDSKLMLKLYYLPVLTSLLTGCDTNVTLTPDCPFRAWKLWWKLKLTTPETVSKRKKPSNWNFINKGIQICLKMWAPDQWTVNKGKIVIHCMQSSTIPKYRSNIFWPVHTYLIKQWEIYFCTNVQFYNVMDQSNFWSMQLFQTGPHFKLVEVWFWKDIFSVLTINL